MTDYARINFGEIEPTADGDGIEGRFSRKHIDSRDLGVSHFRSGPGVRSAKAHRHREQEEAYLVTCFPSRER